MKSKHLLICAFSSLFLLVGCQTDDMSTYQWWPFQHRHSEQMVAKTNADIFGELVALNKAEMSVAEVGKMRAQNVKVKRLANYLYNGHHQALRKTLSVSRGVGIAPATDAKVMMIQTKSQEEIARLKLVNRSGFDKAFVDAVIHCHEKALKLLDKDIMLSTNAKLTALLKDTRMHVEAHLQKARMLQNQMM